MAFSKVSFQNAWKRFANTTVLHGFAQMYAAETKFWKIFWFLVCLGASAATVYQGYGVMAEFVKEPTVTVIQVAKVDEMFYPPLRLCYWQWYFWIDWNKATELTSETDTILYSLRYFNTIFTTHAFDLVEAKLKLAKLMAENNYTTLSQLYKSMARALPIKAGSSIEHYFDGLKIVFNEPYAWLCYEVSSKNMVEYFSNSTSRTITFDVIDETYEHVSHMLTENEYNRYILKWIHRNTAYNLNETEKSQLNLTKFAPPISVTMYNNAEKSLQIVFENDQYMVDVRASVFKWLDKRNKRCLEDAQSVPFNITCSFSCLAYYDALDCSCQYLDHASVIGTDLPDSLCHKDLTFLTPSTNTSSFIAEKKSRQECREDPIYIKMKQNCLDACVPACTIWKYEKTIHTKTSSDELKKLLKKNATKISIEYPAASDVIVVIEIDAQNWQTFVGNVGGILGIWTGASVVSFIQMIYLCCVCEPKKLPHSTTA